jgi:hypothetical protein
MDLRFATRLTLSLALSAAPALQAQTPPPAAAQAPQPAAAPAAFTQGELEQMLAPIALYPDALLSQMLMASTYPLEVVEAARWRKANAALKDKALQDALQQQRWDPSVKSLTAFPEVLERMNQDLAWTQKLGDAFLGQQKEMLDTVQTLRNKAQAAGNLKSNEQQTVKVETQESKQVIVIEPANPQVVYVPTYQPTVVYGGWGYPAYPPYYPPYWYPPVATPLVSGFFWGVGIAAGAALWGGVNWGGGDVNIDIDRHNNFNRTNISNTKFEHKAEHRGSVPYRDTASRDKFQGSDRQAAQAREQFRGRDDSLGGQGLQDRQGLQQARNDPAVRDAAANRGAGQAGTRDLGGDRGGAQAGTRDLGGGAGAGAGNRAATTPSRPAQADRGGAFAGGDGASARAASNRGHSSISGGAARSGGGAARSGGGGRGGGGRR